MRPVQDVIEDIFEAGDPDGIVPDCFITVDGQEVVLHPVIALMRRTALAARERERLAYCEAHNIDPDRWSGCHACEGTGFDRRNHLPCFCEDGRLRSLQQAHQDELETIEIRNRLRNGLVLPTVAA